MKLFTPIKFGNVELKNRITLLPMATEMGDHYTITDKMIDFYAQRARGGAGLLAIGSLMVFDLSNVVARYPSTRHSIGIWSDEFIPGLEKLADAIRENGSKSCAQLNIHYEWRKDADSPLDPVGASVGPGGHYIKEVRPLTVEEIKIVVSQFGDAALRAKKAGFDMIEIHIGIGFLVNRFISKLTNKRTDEYGGSLENRLRIVREIITDCQAKAGQDYPIVVRMAGDELMPGGNTIEDTKEIVPLIEKMGVAAFNIQAGFHEAPRPMINQFVEDGAFVYLAEEVKKVTKLPVITAYRLDSAEMVAKIVEEGRADLVGLGRALIADPEFPNKAQSGHPEKIRRCIVCSRCLDGLRQEIGLTCSVNAEVASPLGLPKMVDEKKKKKVLIIGAGPGGMEAARVAAIRGHQVTLIDKSCRLGGLLNMACILNEKLERLISWYKRELKELPIDIRLETPASDQLIKQLKPDVIIVSPGGDPIMPVVNGVDGKNVLGGFDIKQLIEGVSPKPGVMWRVAAIGARQFGSYPRFMRMAMGFPWPVKRRLAIIGGGFAGFEIALAMNKGREVTIIEESKRLGNDIGPVDRFTELNIIKERGVVTKTLSKVKKFTSQGVIIEKEDGTMELVEADTIMLALGVAENRTLYNELSSKYENVHLIGDGAGGNEIRRIREAVRDGYDVAMRI